MITSPTNTIKLTDQQSEAIKEAKRRLDVLQSETTAQAIVYGATFKDVQRAIKEREYQEQLILKKTEEVKLLTTQVEGLTTSKVQMELELDRIRQEVIENNEKMAKSRLEISEKQAILNENTKKHEETMSVLRQEKTKLEEERNRIEVTKEAFKQAINTWK